MAAVRAEDDVVASQMSADAGGDRLLADVGVAGAVNEPALVRAGQLLLAPADEHHAAVDADGRLGTTYSTGVAVPCGSWALAISGCQSIRSAGCRP